MSGVELGNKIILRSLPFGMLYHAVVQDGQGFLSLVDGTDMLSSNKLPVDAAQNLRRLKTSTAPMGKPALLQIMLLFCVDSGANCPNTNFMWQFSFLFTQRSEYSFAIFPLC
jgi:hypothetical protein